MGVMSGGEVVPDCRGVAPVCHCHVAWVHPSEAPALFPVTAGDLQACCPSGDTGERRQERFSVLAASQGILAEIVIICFLLIHRGMEWFSAICGA